MAETQAKVVFDYNPDGPNQLELRKGQIITILGQPNSDGWIEAKKGAQVGWIPAGYCEVTKTTSSTSSAAGEKGGSSASVVGSSSKPPASATSNYSSAGKVANTSDSFAMFAYQTEWWTYTIATVGALLVLFNGTADATDNPRNWILGTFAIILVCVLIASHARDSVVVCCLPCMENALLSRLIMWVVIVACLGASWPIGWFVVLPIIVCISVQGYMMRAQIGAPPPAMTDSFLTECEWLCCNPSCGTGRLIAALVYFLLNVVAGIWGYIDGEMRAEDLQDKVDAWDIRTETYAAQTMFGRMFTVNLFIVTLISLRTCCVEGSDGAVGMICSPWTNPDLRKTLHRVGGYYMVFSLLWHLWFAYYSYELSGSRHDYFRVFGYETAITGAVLLMCMSLIIASSNNSFYKFDKGTFKWVHPFMAWLLLICLIFHGEKGLNTLYWYIGLLPTVMYTGDIFLRMVRDTNASPQDEF